MAKVSPVSIKYMIVASFAAEGPIEKPDVIGAIFGQTEGLLGTELEMRELQKEGKIGRIEVDLNTVDGRTVGEIKLPSALDKSETTIIAATLETIDKIGPSEAKVTVSKIEDVRGSKRDFIIERAKALLEGLDSTSSGSMSKTLKEESRAAKIQEYGEEQLPAGDLSGDEIIVVEGRADVVNLLKNRVNNVIGMNGAKLPKEIARLSKDKELTLFVDGDRGGKLIAKNVCENARIVYIAVAPDGKEVEELEGKEILLALRRRMPAKDFLYRNSRDSEEHVEVAPFSGDFSKALKEKYEEIKGSKKALLLNADLSVSRSISSVEVVPALNRVRGNIVAVIIDGIATKQIVQACEEKGVSYIAAKNFAAVETNIELIGL
ncbi:DNA primase [Candidatus Pacearchaeota archaeon]|nr:DNA primase [Candidatus Pacearchaeota archaeon]